MELKHLWSPARWVANASNLLLQWVGQRTVLLFIALDVVMSCFACWFYARYRRVTYLGWPSRDFKGQLGMITLRMIFSICGIYAVSSRKIHLTKMFFGCQFLMLGMAVLQVTPIPPLECECVDWFQCHALTSFTKESFNNPFVEPEGVKESKRKVLYEESPQPVEEAVAFKEVFITRPGDDHRDGGQSQLQLGSHKVTDAGPRRLVQKRRGALSNVVGQLMPDVSKADDPMQVRRQRAEYIVHRVTFRTAQIDLELKAARRPRVRKVLLQRKQRLEEDRSYQEAKRFLEDHAEPVRAAPHSGLQQLSSVSAGLIKEHADPANDDEDKGPKHALKKNMLPDKAPTEERRGGGLSNFLGGAKLPMHMSPVRFFDITQHGIVWTSSAEADCAGKTVSEEEAQKVKETLLDFMPNADVPMDQFLYSRLYMCLADKLCGAVRAQVVQNATDKSSYHYEICDMFVQVVPKLASRADPQEASTPPLAQVFFQRNPIRIKEELEEKDAKSSTFFRDAFRTMNAEEGMTKVRDFHNSACICDEPTNMDVGHSPCRTYKDNLGEDRFWCYVRRSSFQECIDEGIQLFWDGHNKKIWSESLCERAGCQCSNIGMHPRDIKADFLNKSILALNKMNYGDSCANWNVGSPEFCYVGYVSTCPDQARREKVWASSDYARMPVTIMQFKSNLPCDKEKMDAVMSDASDLCEDLSKLAEVVLIVNVALFLPMLVITFKFLSNRCGDHFVAEEQFAVILSTDEEESEDEWKPAKPGEKPEGESGRGRDSDGSSDDEWKSRSRAESTQDAGAKPGKKKDSDSDSN